MNSNIPIDTSVLKNFLKNLNSISSFKTGTLDMNNKLSGPFVVQDIYGKYISKNPKSAKEYSGNLNYLINNLKKAHPAVTRKNLFGLTESILPITFRGNYFGSYYIYPFFIGEPDIKILKSQAKKFGFNEKEFLKAAAKIPVKSDKEFKKHITFLNNYSKIVTDFEFRNIEKAQTEKNLSESEERYRNLVNLSPDAIAVHSEGRIVFANPAAVKLLKGKTVSNIIGLSVKDIIHPESWKMAEKRIRKMYKGEFTPRIEEKFVRLDGKIIDVEVSAMPIKYENKPAVQVFIRDITERKISEREHIIKDTAIDSSMSAVGLADLDGKLIYANKTYLKLWGYKNINEIKGKPIYEFAESKEMVDYVFNRLSRGKTFVGEGYSRKKDGTLFYTEMSANVVFSSDGNPICFMASFLDITKRKKAEEALLISNERFREVSEITSDYAYSIHVNPDRSFKMEWATESIKKVTGYYKDNIPVGDSYLKMIYSDDVHIVLEEMESLLKGKRTEREYRIIRNDGKLVWIQNSARSIYNKKEKRFDRIVGGIKDITERKLSEQKIKESEEKFRTIFENSADAIGVSKDREHLFGNHSYISLFGYKNYDELKGKSIFDLIAPSHRKQVIKNTRMRKNGEDVPNNYETKGLRKDGTEFDMDVRAAYYVYNNKIYSLVILRDITESKRAKENLSKLNERFNLAVKAAQFGVWDWDIKNNVLVWDDKMYELYGLRKEDFAGAYEAWLKGVHPDDMDISNKISQMALKGEKEYDTEFRIIHPNGNTRIMKAYGLVIRDEKGNPLRMTGVNYDITEKKITEEALRDSEMKYRNIFENIRDVFYRINDEGIITEISPSIERYSGYSREELIGKNVDKTYYDKNDRVKLIELLLKNKEVEDFEIRLRTKNGDVKWTSMNARGLFDDAGNFCGIEGSMRDITDRKRAEDAMKESEKRYKIFIDSTDDMAYLKDNEFRYIILNKANADFFGKKECEIIGKTDFDFMPESAAIRCRETDESAIASDSVYVDVECLNERFYETHKFKVQLSNNTYGVGGYIRDITERKLAEQAIKESERKINSLIGNIPGTVYRCKNDPQWTMEYLSNGCTALTGYEPDEFIKNKIITYDEIIDADDRQMVWNEIQHAINEKKRYELTYRIHTKDNKQKWVWEKGAGIFDNSGDLLSLEGLIVDVTENKEAEDIIRESEERFSKAFHSSPFAISISDMKTGKLLDVNESYLKLTGYSKEETIGRSTVELNMWIDSNEREKVSAKLKKYGSISGIETEFKMKSGEIRKWHSSLEVIEISGNKCILSLIEDVTEKKLAEEALRIAKEKAEEMNRIKSSFFSTMSHELRTPMTGILGFAEILYNELENPEHKKMAGVILNGGNRLTNTLNMILDLTKIEADKMKAAKELVNISGIISDSCNLFKAFAEEKKLKLECEISEDVYSILDGILLDKAVSNLIKNAITYTNKGSVIVSLEKEILNDINYAVIKVSDTGIGIPSDMTELIFDPFRQVSEGWGRNYEGTGLGLSITKKFVELMGGIITVESELNKGTVFTMKFPAENHTNEYEIIKKPELFNPENPSRRHNLLLVEDDEFSVSVTKQMLAELYDIDVTDTGEKAIEIVKNNKYDAILMDIGLPGMGGLEAANIIRKIDGYDKIPIVALTAFAMKGDREEFLNGGCSHYLSKPFTIKELHSLVNEILTVQK